MSRTWAALASALALLLAASPALALSLSPDPIALSGAGATGTLRLRAVTTGIPDTAVATPIGGAAPSVADVTLVFSLEMGPSRSLAGAVVFDPGATVKAAGWLPGSEPDARRDVSVAVGSSGLVGFGFEGGIGDGEVSDDFFLTFAAAPVGAPLRVGLSGYGPSSTLFTVLRPFTLVPEPTSALLVALGLSGLRAQRRRSQRPADAPAACARAARGTSRRGRRRRGAG